jgi:hypothetical protein
LRLIEWGLHSAIRKEVADGVSSGADMLARWKWSRGNVLVLRKGSAVYVLLGLVRVSCGGLGVDVRSGCWELSVVVVCSAVHLGECDSAGRLGCSSGSAYVGRGSDCFLCGRRVAGILGKTHRDVGRDV